MGFAVDVVLDFHFVQLRREVVIPTELLPSGTPMPPRVLSDEWGT